MSERLHPGPHPDADSLSAFIEGVLSEHERLQCLAHLAECDRCREVVFVAQELPVPAAPKRVPIRRRWFAPIPVLGAAAAACLVVAAVWIYLHRTPTMPPAHEVATQPVLVSPPAVQQQAQTPPFMRPSTKSEPHRSARRQTFDQNGPGFALLPLVPRTQPTLPPPPRIAYDVLPSPPAFASPAPQAVGPPPQDSLSVVTGTVTDPSGAVVPGATVALRQLDTSSSTNAQTDTSGRFKVTGLPPGRYELKIAAPGFQQTSRYVDLAPQEVAVVTPTLSIGASAQTVEVTAAVPSIETESASLAPEPHPLPSKLPVATTLANGKIMLSVDSAGTLFLSQNKGKRWKAVKPVWTGKVVELAEPDQPSTAKFKLTTDSGSEWLSIDGSHWYQAH
jgi:Carboxypeptidase regulatory-like domain/Putative zinc-finger